MKSPVSIKIIAVSLAALWPAVRSVAAPASTVPIASMDLHTHSYCSDGDKTPEALVREAGDMGLAYYALTDHNTTGCLARARAASKELGIKFIPGIELTADDDSLHILGLGIDPQASEIAALCEKNKASREARMFAIVKKLPRGRPAGAAPIDLIADILLPSLNQERLTDGRERLTPAQASGMTVAQIHQETGESHDSIRRHAAPRRPTPPGADLVAPSDMMDGRVRAIREALDQGEIKMGHAIQLTRLKDPIRQEEVFGNIKAFGMTVAAAKGYISETLALIQPAGPPQPPAPPPPPMTFKCAYCEGQFLADQIANPFTCRGCSGAMFASMAEVHRIEAKEREAAGHQTEAPKQVVSPPEASDGGA